MKTRRLVVISFVALVSLSWIAVAQAQVQDNEWSEPYRLSSEAGVASAGHCAADPYGFVHCFWTEELYADQRTVIQYSRFDGESWSTQNAIFVTGAGIADLSPVVDQNGILRLSWAEGLSGPVFYSHAPAYDAQSARSWASPIRLDLPAGTLRLRVDLAGVLHLIYINRLEESGVFYVRSEDGGLTWSEPVWLDPDILPNHIPDGLNFELDEAGGLHVVWYYGALDPRDHPDWLRYMRSLDGGHTWSVPTLIDQAVPEDGYNLNSPGPIMLVRGKTVHIIWAAGALNYRHHRYSEDAGLTWSPSRRLFGELNGQAGDGLALDGAGRLHYFAQIRYPQGIYHATWDQGQWSMPELIYLILEGSSPNEVMGDRIHAHETYPVVLRGNQLILAFADGPADPNRRLFAMHRTLDDVVPLTPVPTPVPIASPVVEQVASPAGPTPAATPTARPTHSAFAKTIWVSPSASVAMREALKPTLLILAATVAVTVVSKLRQR